MANSLTTDWLSENSQRSFPLTQDAERVIPNDLLVDAKLIGQQTADYPALTSITVSGDYVTFIVARGGSLSNLTFTIDRTSELDEYVYVRSNTTGDLLVAGPGIRQLTASKTGLNLKFEPHCVVELTSSWRGVSSLRFTKHRVGVNGEWTNEYGYTGAIRFRNGYNFSVTSDVEENSISLEARGHTRGVPGVGWPIACMPFLKPGYGDCDQYLQYVNNTSAEPKTGNINLVEGDNVNIFTELGSYPNHVFVGLTFNPPDGCLLPPI